jgi:hypothetical protein
MTTKHSQTQTDVISLCHHSTFDRQHTAPKAEPWLALASASQPDMNIPMVADVSRQFVRMWE